VSVGELGALLGEPSVAFGGEAVFLQAAIGLVWECHFKKTLFQKGKEVAFVI
jgi:hypothetical protein